MSLLSALLTQDQVVSPEKLDEAIQRQVLSGGDFETSLLEVGAIAEDTLAAYCAAVYDLPLATRDEVVEADPVAIARIPRAAAERFGVTALRIERGQLLVACAHPLDTATRAALADLAGIPVDPRIATPFRVSWALWRYYTVPLAARYVRLADKLHTRAPGAVPVVSVSAARESLAPDPRAASQANSTRSALAALAKALEDDEDEDDNSDDDAPATEPPAAPSRPPHEAQASASTPRPLERTSPVPDVSVPVAIPPGTRPAAPPTSRPPPAMAGVSAETSAALANAVTRPHPVPGFPSASVPAPLPAPAVATVPETVPGDSRRTPSLAEVQARLAAVDSRDGVIATMLDHLAGRFAYVAAFVLHGEEAEGLSGRGDGALNDTLRSTALSLEAPNVLRDARDKGELVSRNVAADSADASVRATLLRASAQYVVAAPVRVAGRVALIVWADAGAVAPSAATLRDLGAFLEECGGAFTRVVRSRKQSTSPPPAMPARPGSIQPPVASRPPAAVATAQTSNGPQRANRPSRDQQLQALRQVIVGVAPPNPGPRDPEPVLHAQPSGPPDRRSSPANAMVSASTSRSSPAVTPIRSGEGPVRSTSSTATQVIETDRLVAEVVRSNVLSDETAAALVGQGERALEVIFRHFPGPTTLDRTQVPLRLPSLTEAGPLLRLVVTFRQAAVPRLLNALDVSSPDVRFAALLCLGEIVHPAALPKLSPRLLDPDYATRMATIEVLRGYRRFPEFAEIGKTLRGLLADATSAPDRRRIAAHALGELRDTDAAPSLITALGDADFALAGSAHRALVVLTRQDFGTDTARWLAWWDRARGQHRIEWLIDALLHSEPTIRHDASEELKRVSGQFFGYYFNLPRRERERAHQRYVDWWKREGAPRYAERR